MLNPREQENPSMRTDCLAPCGKRELGPTPGLQSALTGSPSDGLRQKTPGPKSECRTGLYSPRDTEPGRRERLPTTACPECFLR